MRDLSTFSLAFLLVVFSSASCGSDDGGGGGGDCAVGSESCPCTAGGACDPGLTCLSDLCVDAGSDADSDVDSDVDSDADTDADSDSDSDSDTGCSAASCAGCCDGDTCMDGDTNEACGIGGGACGVCEAIDACGAGECALDGMHEWTLRAIGAATVGTGDVGYGSSDPYVVVTLGGDTAQSAFDDYTLAPIWNEDLLTLSASRYVSDGDSLEIRILDDDTYNGAPPDEELGSCTHAITEEELRAGGFTIAACDDTYYYGATVTDLEFELNPL